MKEAGSAEHSGRHGAREGAAIALLFALVLCAFFFDVVFLGRTLRLSNTISTTLPSGQYGAQEGFPPSVPVYDNTPGILEEPYQAFKARSLARGVFPLWNPHQAAGYPFLATMESSLLFVPEIALYAAPESWGWDFYLLLRLWLAGLFTYAFARAVGLSRLPAVAAGIAYMVSGPVVSWMTNVTTNADLLAPLLLLLVERILRRDFRRDVVFAAVVVFQCVAGGHPEHTFFTLLAALLYALMRLGQGAAAPRSAAAGGRLAIALAAGLGLSAVLLLPFGEYLFGHAWHVHGDRPGLESIPWRLAITMVFPGAFAPEPGSAQWNTWPGGWMGIMAVWLAFSAFVARGAPRARAPLVILFTAGLLKVYGFPVLNLIGALPILRLVKYPLHSTQMIALSGAVLCGIAVSALRDDEGHLRRFALVGLLILVAATAAFALKPPTHPWSVAVGIQAALFAAALLASGLAGRRLIGRRALAAAVALLLALELFLLIPRTRSMRAEVWRVPPYIATLRRDPRPFRVFGIHGCLYPDTATAFGLDDIGVYEGLFVDRFTTYIRELVDDRLFAPGSFHAFREDVRNPASPFLDLLNLRYFIVPREEAIPPQRQAALSLRPVYEGEVRIYERMNAMPRSMIRHRADFVDDDGRTLRALRGGYDLRRGVILKGPAPPGMRPDAGPADEGSAVLSESYGVNRKAFRVRMAREGYLVVNDVNYPGWHARVDGKAAPLWTANYLFQAVRVPAGEHRVALRFAPRSLGAGLVVSLASMIALLLWARAGRRRTGIGPEA